MDEPVGRKLQLMKTRRKIFDCATRLFEERTYEQVKISDICQAAGVSVGAFYHHFPSKESILNEGYREFDRTLEERWNNTPPPTHQAGVRFLLGAQLDSMAQSGPVYSLQLFKNQLTNEEKYVLDRRRFLYRTLFQEIEALVEQGELFGQAPQIAEELLRAARGTIYDWCLNAGSYDLVTQGMRLLEMVLEHYSQRPEPGERWEESE